MTTDTQFLETPLNKPSKLAIKKIVKQQRELDINQMSSGQIMLHLAIRHRFLLVLIWALTASALLFIHW